MKKFIILSVITGFVIFFDLKITAMLEEQPTPYDVQTNGLPPLPKSPLIEKKFPEITGTTLENKKITLPQDIKGKIGIIVLSFKKKSQKSVDLWTNYILENYSKNKDVAYYEIPIISWFYYPISWFIDNSMKRHLNKDLHSHVLTSYGRVRKYIQELNIKNLNTSHVFVLDKQGKIAQVYEGEPTQAKLQNLRLQTNLLKIKK
ncbi:mitochondrial ATPase complex subunit ATP10 [Candidatus Dependentiae bacterium]|nr:mitochondrial ATPase complex subunit ATP10 [Candidatus Dependentiae bacterium]